jgi:hypothetical protein
MKKYMPNGGRSLEDFALERLHGSGHRVGDIFTVHC